MASPTFSSPADDWKDGAGGVIGPPLLQACLGPGANPANPTSASGNSPGDLSGAANSPSECERVDCIVNDPPPGGQSVQPLGGVPAYTDGRHYTTLYDSAYLSIGKRLRAALVWDSCPVAMEGGDAPAPATTDYDLVALNRTTGRYVVASISLDDVTEGFDLTIDGTTAPEGEYSVLVSYPEGSKGCEQQGWEPYSWNVWEWH